LCLKSFRKNVGKRTLFEQLSAMKKYLGHVCFCFSVGFFG
jgi:hypothetical protein